MLALAACNRGFPTSWPATGRLRAARWSLGRAEALADSLRSPRAAQRLAPEDGATARRPRRPASILKQGLRLSRQLTEALARLLRPHGSQVFTGTGSDSPEEGHPSAPIRQLCSTLLGIEDRTIRIEHQLERARPRANVGHDTLRTVDRQTHGPSTRPQVAKPPVIDIS